MASSESEPSQRTKSSHLRKTRLLGGISLTLWGSAIGTVAVMAGIAFDRPRLLVFIRGLFMLDLSAAVLATLIWYLAKYHLQPQTESRAIAEYSYRAGCRDTTMRLLRATELHLVRTMPPPATPPTQQPHEYVPHTNGRQRTGAPT